VFIGANKTLRAAAKMRCLKAKANKNKQKRLKFKAFALSLFYSVTKKHFGKMKNISNKVIFAAIKKARKSNYSGILCVQERSDGSYSVSTTGMTPPSDVPTYFINPVIDKDKEEFKEMRVRFRTNAQIEVQKQEWADGTAGREATGIKPGDRVFFSRILQNDLGDSVQETMKGTVLHVLGKNDSREDYLSENYEKLRSEYGNPSFAIECRLPSPQSPSFIVVFDYAPSARLRLRGLYE
jgi:hypothetical protein